MKLPSLRALASAKELQEIDDLPNVDGGEDVCLMSMISWSYEAYRLPMCVPPLCVGDRVIGAVGVGDDDVVAVVEDIRKVVVKAGKIEMCGRWEQCFPAEMGDWTYYSLGLLCIRDGGGKSRCRAPAGVVRRPEIRV